MAKYGSARDKLESCLIIASDTFPEKAKDALEYVMSLENACELVDRAWAGDGVDMAVAVDACLLALEGKGD